jgi:hypothetical protein
VWSTNSSQYSRDYAFVGKTLTRVELDPDHLLLDIERDNNVWTPKSP